MPIVATDETTDRRVTIEEAMTKTVADVMIKRPKTLPPDALVADVRAAFERPTVRTVLLADGDRFVGAIERGGLPTDAADGAPARAHIEPNPATVTPELSMADAVELLERRGEPRLIVLDPDGVTLRGLLCADAKTTGFCVR